MTSLLRARCLPRPLAALCAVVAASTAAMTTAQNTALSLQNGSVDVHIDVPATPFAIPARGITVEAWITYDDASIQTGINRWPTIVRHTDTPNMESYLFRVQAASFAARRLAFLHRNVAGNLQEVAYDFAIGEFANWTHVAATFDGSTSSLYVNGSLVNQVATTGPIRDGGGTLRIGNGDLSTPGAEVWNGGIDDLRIWPFARTQAEILETMNVSLFGIVNGMTFNLDSNPIDTSQGVVGVETPSVSYVAGSTLPFAGLGAGNFGVGTTTCMADRMLASAGSRARAGNTSFELVFAEGPANAPGGVLLAAFQAPMPFTFLSADLYVDLLNLIPVVPSASTDAQGLARLPITLSASTQIGLQIHTQALFVDPCGAEGLVASEGLQFIVQ